MFPEPRPRRRIGFAIETVPAGSVLARNGRPASETPCDHHRPTPAPAPNRLALLGLLPKGLLPKGSVGIVTCCRRFLPKNSSGIRRRWNQVFSGLCGISRRQYPCQFSHRWLCASFNDKFAESEHHFRKLHGKPGRENSAARWEKRRGPGVRTGRRDAGLPARAWSSKTVQPQNLRSAMPIRLIQSQLLFDQDIPPHPVCFLHHLE
jgi:hypothetical protein